MAKIDRSNLGYLGADYQLRLIAQILTDRKFGNAIIDIVNPNYFEDEYLRIVVGGIKNAKAKDDIIPDINSLEFRLLEEVKDDTQRRYALTQIRKIKEADLNDTLWVQETAMKFCKQHELMKALAEINKIISKGDIDNYEECESKLRKALEHGDSKDDGMSVFNDIDSVLADDFRKPIRTGIEGLDEIMDGGLSKTELAIILAPFGVGKALPNSNKIYTPEGYKLMGDVKVNDKVFGRNGKETNVIGVYPQGNRPIFKISFNDDTFTFCDEEHLWSVNSINQRNRSSWKDGKRIKLEPDNSFKVIKTSDLINKLTFGTKKSLNFKIPIVEPVEFNEKELLINPYVLGVMLGDGYMKSSRFTTKDIEIADEVSRTNSVNVSIKERCRDIDKGDVLVQECLFDVCIYGITDKLKSLGLYDKKSDTKFIPTDYLFNSIENRVELLRGLLDTDGNVRKNGGIEYVSTSKELIENVRWLVLSLGGFCKLSSKLPTYTYKGVKKIGKKAYKLTISFPEKNNIIPFKLTRKNDRVINRVKYDNNKFIKSIEYSHDEEATCIMVDNDEHLFITDDFIVTHNTTMMTKIANTAMSDGNKVLQIFFEDNPKVIQRKHLSCWSEYDLNSLSIHKEEIKEMIKNMMEKSNGGELRLKKFSSDGTTIPIIRQYIRKLIATGFRPDIVVLDYIDCVEPSRRFDDVNAGEGSVMRQFETMLSELDIAGWTAVQGNRSSIKADVVEADQMGGSIKKAQIGHFVVSIAKTLDQKEKSTATMAILKSRFGQSGKVFEDIIFDNARIQIEMGENKHGSSRSEYKKNVEIKEQTRVNTVIGAIQTKNSLLNSDLFEKPNN
jgi:replicative DNA helicase